MSENTWTREPHGSGAKEVLYYPDGEGGLRIAVGIDQGDAGIDPGPVLAVLDRKLGKRGLVLGAQAFDDARTIQRTEPGDALRPASLPETARRTGFHGLRLARAIAARDVLAGVLEAEVVAKVPDEEIDG